ncbi:hypothetical protein VINI7043_22587 [Vibrio nigripulchritudo ATCC 27043]|uniref:DUF3069 domain-containing protein n=2 Tax=Vibrio nigripulchritudo TaxID=28173 RepID=U4KIM1_9VIBR|nr:MULTISPECIES: DUF3069 domain-containing protein [Vibrio]EGU57004.1 hypothetical protein VINI7043_22587 [Vibrio nigripulchritudo ATCC 27043]UAB72413.1 DUF3069 domain-containing protein [Vibrio sp. SCSIO 43132]CCN71391.1 conserved hypothetical protein [Vibrio nigripulchritudo SFn118]CCN81525.1 conserved hypothetical protein [Vibrio nigripulchritudo BLFn1]CCN91622.1 conserved hypothetical protein [Vibrio nigripulchritudo SFn27]
MSNETPNTEQKVDLSAVSAELRQVIEFDNVPEEMYLMVTSIHEVSEEAVREAWDALPASAQNVLDNFEQFHALISVSQAFAGLNVMEEFPTLNLPKDMTEEEKEDYRASLLDQVLHNCVKDMTKQLKKARRDAILKRDFNQVFLK